MNIARVASPPGVLPSFTIAELVAMVAGFALAFACWSDVPDATWIPYLGGLPGLGDIPRRAFEILFLSPVILAPLVIAQRGRFCDLPRPAEWLLVSIAVCRLELALDAKLGAYYWSLFEQTGGFFELGDWIVFWSVQGVATLLFALGLSAALVARSRLTETLATTVIVVLGFLLLAGPLFWLSGEIFSWVLSLRVEEFQAWPYRYTLAFALADIPVLLVFAVPIAAMWRDRKRSAASRGLERVGRSLAVALFTVLILHDLGRTVFETLPTYGLEVALATIPTYGIRLLGGALTFAMALGLVATFGLDRMSGPARSRWVGLNDDRGPSPRLSQEA